MKDYLYGSHGKGIAGEWSDIGIGILSHDFSKDLFENRVLLMKLALSVDERIEPIPFRPEDFNIDNPLANKINTSGIELETN